MSTLECLEMNQDIGGLGVRISFYLQTLFLGLLSARTGAVNEFASSFNTLALTGQAMAVTALILGLQQEPEISFQDGIVVIYLLYLSWITLTISLLTAKRFLPEDTRSLPNREGRTVEEKIQVGVQRKYSEESRLRSEAEIRKIKRVYLIHTYTIFSYSLALLIKAGKFGSSPQCNDRAVVALFYRFPVLWKGHILGCVIIGILVFGFTALVVKAAWPSSAAGTPRLIQAVISVLRPEVKILHGEQEEFPRFQEAPVHHQTPRKPAKSGKDGILSDQPDLPIDWRLLLSLLIITVFWSATVANTELLILWNRTEGEDTASKWPFGQVLPLFLLVQPFLNTWSAYRKFGLRPMLMYQRRSKRQGRLPA